ncbi:DNA ligase (ATP), partial [Oleoguttula sp. CCFEE 6159]
MSSDVEMPDAVAAAAAVAEEKLQYGHGALTQEDLDAKYPNRPHNHSKTLYFHELFQSLFNSLSDNRKKHTGPVTARKKQGPHGPANLTPNEVRRSIIERFISRWRKEVGNDIYPAFRLIIPEKDRDRAMYGLKEKTIGRLFVRIMQIDKNSEDGYNLLNWKLPSQKALSSTAGDFAGRCLEVLSKRPMRTTVGDMTIAEVNEMLDRLSVAQKEEDQFPILQEFYKRMNPQELMWLVRMILRQMHVGATEKTFFDIWHPDAENLFSVSSSLRRVCWELWNPAIRLQGDDRGISLMQCFQPQLAAFQMRSMEQMVSRMKLTEDDDAFWIEEKLDGERMQLHMIEDDSVPCGKRFSFWSRKAKDYTYLYGDGFQDENAALTRHLKSAFNEGVRNIILDGEMITWDPEEDAIVPFGTLKTAALSEQRNPYSTGRRPLYRVFDCLYLNNENLTPYTLRDRRKALEASVNCVHRRLEIHQYTEAHNAAEIEPLLRQVVAEASEGLVIKNPRSMYRLNERNDDWIKIKPEYMVEFGEALDCIVIGGYYGSGHRGGRLSSFLCGLKVDQNQVQQGASPLKCFSFFKVGGGFAASDYAEIRHHTDSKWNDWDPKNPPTEFIELGGGDRQYERPDVWIRPDESVVLSVKAASVASTDQFRMGMTLRFPRFKKLRTDKDFSSALSIQGFIELKNNAEREHKDKQFKIDDARRRNPRKARKKTLVVAGNDEVLKMPYGGPETKVFDGMHFYIMTEFIKPVKKSKAELEQLVKANGGIIVQSQTAAKDVVCVACRNLVKVASLQKSGTHNIVRPSWLFDCIKQAETDVGRPNVRLPFEPEHMFFVTESDRGLIELNIDEYGDSFAQDVTTETLNKVNKQSWPLDYNDILGSMPSKFDTNRDRAEILGELGASNAELDVLPGWMFQGLVLYIDRPETAKANGLTMEQSCGHSATSEPSFDRAVRTVKFASGCVTDDLHDPNITHVVIGADRSRLRKIREVVSRCDKFLLNERSRSLTHRWLYRRPQFPRLLTIAWILDSWTEKTRLDEE